MAKVEIPELTQALAVLTNETATVISELNDLVQVIVFAIENATITITRSVDVIYDSIANINLIVTSAVDVARSVNGTIRTTNNMMFYVMACLCFMLVSIGVFFLVASFVRIFYVLRAKRNILLSKPNTANSIRLGHEIYKGVPNE